LDIYICVGSSCHLKGSYYILKSFQELIKKYNVENQVELKASFCLGNCTNAVSVKVQDDVIGGVTPDNAEQKFKEHVLGRLQYEHNQV